MGWNDNLQSRVLGSLVLERSPIDSSRFKLKVRSQLLMIHNPDGPYGGLREIEADLECELDALATPRRWRVVNRFHRHGQVMEHLPLLIEGRFEDGLISSSINGRPQALEIAAPWSNEWCLFEALPRMAAGDPTEQRFQQLHQMRSALPDQRLFRRAEADYVSSHYGPLRCFSQTGYANLPIDYWVDDKGDLPFVTNLHTAYIIDDQAEAKIERILKDKVMLQFEKEELAQ